MKYINFKRYKFSTVVKKFNTLVYNFLKIFKSIDLKRYDFKKIYKYIDISRFSFISVTKYTDLKRYDFKKIYKYIDISRFSFISVAKYTDLKKYNISRLKKIDFVSSKFLLLHFPTSIIFFGFLYLVIPTFYNYDKSVIEKEICKINNIECLIRGEVNYRFYPTPRLKVEDLAINGFIKNKFTLITSDDVSINLSFKNLLAKKKHKFKKIELNNFETNVDLKNLKKYKDIFNKKINLIPLVFKNGQIVLYEGNNYVASITEANIKAKFIKANIEAELKGKFLNDSIYINLNSKNIDNKTSTDLILKMRNLNFLTKTNFFNTENDKKEIDGNFLVKKDKNKITGIFGYNNNKLTIKKSNFKNTFIDGKLEGQITLLPFFVFDLDFNLNSINFTRLYNYFLTLDEKEQKNLFKVNNKINGKLNFSADKVYSKHNLVNSFESRMKFYNGNVHIEQFLINLGKLGAADMLGIINNDKEYTNFKFESNVFVDNEKKFLSKLGIYNIYNKENLFSSLFVSGNFDFENIRTNFYEISDNKEFNSKDINYIESEFNDLMLENGFSNLFDFRQFKVFLKSITSEKN